LLLPGSHWLLRTRLLLLRHGMRLLTGMHLSSGMSMMLRLALLLLLLLRLLPQYARVVDAARASVTLMHHVRRHLHVRMMRPHAILATVHGMMHGGTRRTSAHRLLAFLLGLLLLLLLLPLLLWRHASHWLLPHRTRPTLMLAGLLAGHDHLLQLLQTRIPSLALLRTTSCRYRPTYRRRG